MQALVPPDEYNLFMATLPARHLPDDQNAPFGAMFNDAKIWFNHAIEVDQGEMIHVSLDLNENLRHVATREYIALETDRYRDADAVVARMA
jgi:hypothetical protein